MKKVLKTTATVFLLLFIVIQFYPRAAPNNNPDASRDIGRVHLVPPDVERILETACYDCHSNKTVYPWYSKLQPVSYWLNDHIVEGKKELNFSEFAGYRLAKQFHKLEEVIGEVKENKMPLESYSFVHTDAKLTQDQKLQLANWAQAIRDSMRSVYPPDSLIRKK